MSEIISAAVAMAAGAALALGIIALRDRAVSSSRPRATRGGYRGSAGEVPPRPTGPGPVSGDRS